MSGWYHEWEKRKEDRDDRLLDSTPDYTIARVNGVPRSIKLGDRTYTLIREENFMYFTVGEMKYILYPHSSEIVNNPQIRYGNGAFLSFEGSFSQNNKWLSSATGKYHLHYIAKSPNSNYFILLLTLGVVQTELFENKPPDDYKYYKLLISPRPDSFVQYVVPNDDAHGDEVQSPRQLRLFEG